MIEEAVLLTTTNAALIQPKILMDRKIQQEMDLWAFKQAGQIAGKTYQKLGGAHPIDLSFEDIKAELLLWYSVRRDKVIADWDGKPGSWKSYVAFMLNNRARTRMSKAFDNRAKQAGVSMSFDTGDVGVTHNEEGVIEHIVIENRNPELLMIEQQEERRMAARVDVEIEELQEFCASFNIEFNENEMLQCLLKVLDHALNQISDDDFAALPEYTQTRLAQLGEAVKRNGLNIKMMKGKIRTVGIVDRIKGYFDQGITTTADIIARMDQERVIYNRDSVHVIIGNVRRKKGLPPAKTEKSSISSIIRKEFDEGRGIIDVSSMQLRLNELGVHYIPSSVRFVVNKLLRQYQIKRR